MKLIESKAEYIPQESGLEGIYKMVELAGRTAYKSEDKITPDSAKGFVDRMIKSNHGACLEHGTVYLKVKLPDDEITPSESLYHYKKNAYSKYIVTDRVAYISTNLRVIVENLWLDDLQYQCEPTEQHKKRYTMKFTCDRGVSHELVRHRAFSFLQESTRYCNYSKDKFGNELTFIIPSWFTTLNEKGDYKGEIRDGSNRVVLGEKTFQLSTTQGYAEHYLCSRLVEVETSYFWLLKQGYNPQQARQILPNALKTEIIMTGFASDWRHFFDLRLFGKTGAPHPDMKLLAEKAQKAMQDASIWDDIMNKESKFE